MSFSSNFDLESDHARALKAVEREMNLIGLLIVRDAAQILREGKKNYEGDVKKSLTHEVKRFFDEMLILIVGAGANHAKYLHFGTRPHWPPPEPIREWVRKKLAVDPLEVKSVAFLIARKISIKGTKPFPFLDNALKKHQSNFARRVESAYISEFKRSS